ncbi:MAG: gephyrin-like molybdotransferase Glp [Thermodesulfobacteriota bacterium]
MRPAALLREAEDQPIALSVEEARAAIAAQVQPVTGHERLGLRSALGRVLAHDLFAPGPLPPWTTSAMDGYALHSRDLPALSDTMLAVIGRALAGHPFAGAVGPGECVQIMTGAVLPAGCDTVLRQEDVERLGDSIRVQSGQHRPGDHVRWAGEDIAAGGSVLRQGHRLEPADLGLIASLGLAEVCVRRQPKVAFFSTGDELQGLGQPLTPGMIYDSNRYTLHAMLEGLSVRILDRGTVPDDPQALETVLTGLAGQADLVLSTGGVSVGAADYVTATLQRLGEIFFWKIAMKPGKPLLFGRVGSALFFGLPGNPVSVLATFMVLVRGAILRLAGEEPPPRLRLRAHAAQALIKGRRRTDFQRGILEQGADGRLLVRTTGMQGSHMLSSMSRANCFLQLPAGVSSIDQDEEVEVLPFNTISWGAG